MAFITDKAELKPGLIIFRRGDVTQRNFYCRVKLPKDDRYKTIALATPGRESARDRTFDHDADVRFRLKATSKNPPFPRGAKLIQSC